MSAVSVTVSCSACASPHTVTVWPGTTKTYVCPACNSLNLVAHNRTINLTSGETTDDVSVFPTEPSSLPLRGDA